MVRWNSILLLEPARTIDKTGVVVLYILQFGDLHGAFQSCIVDAGQGKNRAMS